MSNTSINTGTHPKLRFITITDWDKRSDSKTQKIIRSQAMRDFRRKTKKTRPRPENQYLNILPLLQSNAGTTAPAEFSTDNLVNANGEGSSCMNDDRHPEQQILDEIDHTSTLNVTQWLHQACGRDPRNQSPRLAWQLPRTICSHDDAVDPFDSTATRIDSWTHNVVHYYINKLTPDCFIAESRPSCPAPGQFRSAINARIQACLSSELHMFSLMASCSSRMRRFECVTSQSKETSPEYFVDKAVKALRQHLETKPTTINSFIFLDILSLSVAETFMHNHKAAATHLLLIQRLSAHMGGLKEFDPFLREMFSIGDVNLAIEADSVPILSLEWSEWKQESLPAKRMAEISKLAQIDYSLPALEPGILLGWDKTYFSVTILSIVADLAAYLQAAQYIWNQPHSMPGDRKWIFLRGSGIIHRLLSLKGMAEYTSPQPEVEECCRIALLILSHGVVGHARARQFMKVWAPRTKAALLRSNCQERKLAGNPWSARPEIFVWVLSVGFYVAEGTEEADWFLIELTKAVAILGDSPRSAYNRFLQAFFFLEDGARVKLLGILK